jgi:4-hydroxy-tetrahydrodipicolinate synthase
MLTAFANDGSIDWDGVDQITDFYIESGAAGLFAGGLSAEIDQMEDAEKVALADRVVRRTAGRVPVIAGAITHGPLRQQAELARAVAATGADAVTLSVCQLAKPSDPDHVWCERTARLVERLPTTTRLALYECPWPYRRLLSDAMLGWVVQGDRFCFLKDTCSVIETIRARLQRIAGSSLQLFNANAETLLQSLQAGAAGFCGINANYFPELYGWLGDHFASQPRRAVALQHFVTRYSAVTEGRFYPVVAKEYLRLRGLAIGPWSRRRPVDLPAEVFDTLHAMRAAADTWAERLTQPS